MERRSSARARSDSRFLEQPKKGGRELIPYRFTGSKTPREPLFFVWTSLYTYFFKRVLSTASHLFKSSLHSHGAAREITSSEMSRRLLRFSRVPAGLVCNQRELLHAAAAATAAHPNTRDPSNVPMAIAHIEGKIALRPHVWWRCHSPVRPLSA